MIKSRQGIFRAAVLILLSSGVVSAPANADLVSTDQVTSAAQVQQARERIKTLAQRSELADELKQLGVQPEQAQARVDAMTDEEVLTAAGKLDSLVAAGSVSTNDLILILLIVILIIAL
jgi:hypothetical protein